MATSEIAKLESRWRENPQGLTFAPLAEAYRKLKDPVRALEVLRPGLERHPDYIPANIVLGRCHWDLNDLPAAEHAFSHVLSLDGENVIALKALADITERLVRYDEAERWLEALLVVDRSNDEARTQLTRVRTLQAEHGAGTPDAGAGSAAAAAEAPSTGEDATTLEPTAANTDAVPVEAAAPSDPHGSEPADHLEMIEPMDLEPTAFDATELAASAPMAPAEPFAPSEPDAGAPDEPVGFESFDSVSFADGPGSGAGSESMDELIPQEEFSPPPRDVEASADPSDAADLPGATVASDEHAAPVPFFPEYSATEPVAEARPPAFPAHDEFGVERTEDIVLHAGPSEFQAPSAAEDLMQTAGPQGDVLQPEPHVDGAAPLADASAESRSEQGDATIEFAGALAGFDAGAAPDVDLDRPLDAEPAGGFATSEASAEFAPETVASDDAASEPQREFDAFAAPVAEFTPEPAMEPAPGPEAESHLAHPTPAVPPPPTTGTDHPAEPEPDLVVTETMAEVYLRQGHVVEALAVYRELSRRSPNDLGLRNRIAELELRAAAARGGRRAYAASETGGESVAVFLRSILAARPAAVDGPRWSQPAGGSDDASSVTDAGAGAGASAAEMPDDVGAPTRPAGDPLSLGSVFGEEPPASTPAMPESKLASGVSFDEFFGGPRPQSSGTTRPNPAPGGKGGDDDLDQFHAWLQGLKR